MGIAVVTESEREPRREAVPAIYLAYVAARKRQIGPAGIATKPVLNFACSALFDSPCAPVRVNGCSCSFPYLTEGLDFRKDDVTI